MSTSSWLSCNLKRYYFVVPEQIDPNILAGTTRIYFILNDFMRKWPDIRISN